MKIELWNASKYHYLQSPQTYLKLERSEDCLRTYREHSDFFARNLPSTLGC